MSHSLKALRVSLTHYVNAVEGLAIFAIMGVRRGFSLSQLAYLYLWGRGCELGNICTRILFAHTMASSSPVGHDFISLILV